MKNSAKNSSFTNRLAKAQNNGVVSAYKSSIIRWKADVLTITSDSGKTYNVLAYYDLSKDAIIVAIPQTGLPEQGKDRILAIPTSDSAKAEFRAKKILAVSKVEKEINLMCNGRSWAEVVTICGGATRSYKDKAGNIVTKDCYGKISAQSEGLKNVLQVGPQPA